MDNAIVHSDDLELSNIEIFFLPPNSTSKNQPLDQGIIKVFKDYYKKYVHSYAIEFIEKNENSNFYNVLKKLTISHAIKFYIQSWNKISGESIKNCFNHAFKNLEIFEVGSISEHNTEEICFSYIL